jgi:signal peptidase I
MKVWRVIKDLLLLLATFSLIALAILSLHFQTGIISIASASMAPTLRTGDTAMTIQVPREMVKEGDVLVLPHPNAPSIYFAHRVIEVDRSGGGVIVETKGDANPVKDAWRLELESEEVPKVQFTMATSRLPLDASERSLAGRGLFAAALIALLFSFRKAKAPSTPM